MLDYQCVTEKAVASSRRRNSSSKADTRNLFSCADVGVHTSVTTSPENMAVFRRSLVTVGIVNVLTMV